MSPNTHPLSKDECGQALVEYSSILLLVAIACFLVVGFIGQDVADLFQQAADAFPGA
jgi:Flp pilus assembly pilin Flp